MYFLYFLISLWWPLSCRSHGFPVPSSEPRPLIPDYPALEQPQQVEDFSIFRESQSSSSLSSDPYKESFLEYDGHQFRDHRKKSDSRPKYDPGWKFIGLGKRPKDHRLHFMPEFYDSKDGVNPLLGISTLINFEFVNALRNDIADVTKETVKKESAVGSSREEGSYRFGKMNAFSSRQKAMYDPGWMMTGLGK